MKEKPQENMYDLMEKNKDEIYKKLVTTQKISVTERYENIARIVAFQKAKMDNDDRRVVSELQLDDTQLDFSVFVRY
jgi:hypothetical protein